MGRVWNVQYDTVFPYLAHLLETVPGSSQSHPAMSSQAKNKLFRQAQRLSLVYVIFIPLRVLDRPTNAKTTNNQSTHLKL